MSSSTKKLLDKIVCLEKQLEESRKETEYVRNLAMMLSPDQCEDNTIVITNAGEQRIIDNIGSLVIRKEYIKDLNKLGKLNKYTITIERYISEEETIEHEKNKLKMTSWGDEQ